MRACLIALVLLGFAAMVAAAIFIAMGKDMPVAYGGPVPLKIGFWL
jgi:hypothetical protein